jgi:aryl-alcohol dehydrogenase-like predicted oxidoreductase
MKLALGTVQFGLDYGVSNKQGKVLTDEIERILLLAKQAGIDTLDTASAYGCSEQELGDLGASSHFNIVTKLPVMQPGHQPDERQQTVKNHIEQSLQRLNTKTLNGVMFHDVHDLLSPNGAELYKQLQTEKHLKRVSKIGVSVYTPEQLIKCAKQLNLDIVQLPLNCLDQRFLSKEIQVLCAEKKIEVHCRSIFLQGLLLLANEGKLAPYFQPLKHYLTSFWQLAKKLNVTPLQLALAFVEKQQFISKFVVGCCSANELDQIIEAYHAAKNLSFNFTELACNDEQLIIPANWPKKV